MDDVYEALARTAQLLRIDVFQSDPDDDGRIIDGLRATTARIVADRSNLGCVAGQTALTALYTQLAMMGLQIDLDIPDIDMLSRQPPLRNMALPEALVEYSDDLIPGGSSTPGRAPDITFVLGDTIYPDDCVRVAGHSTRAVVAGVGGAAQLRWEGHAPYGAVAAAAAAAADGVRAAVPRIAAHLGVAGSVSPGWTRANRTVTVDLGGWASLDTVVTRRLDIVSGGAITNAALYVLLRVDELSLDARVLEPDRLDLSNLNRYALARRSLVGVPKIDILAGYSNELLSISGEPILVTKESALSLRPWSDRVIVGVDDIRARWLVQEEAPDSWIGVGSTSHDYVLVSEHIPGHACVGCTHPRADDIAGPIPTIGFVSLWAGLGLALKLLGSGSASGSRATEIWPLGLEHRLGVRQYDQTPVPQCPVGCLPSRSRR